MSFMDKRNAIAAKVYHADGVDLVGKAPKQLGERTALGFSGLPICMAKTQYSFSDDPRKLGAPRNLRVAVRNLKVSAGAGFTRGRSYGTMEVYGCSCSQKGGTPMHCAEYIDISMTGRSCAAFTAALVAREVKAAKRSILL